MLKDITIALLHQNNGKNKSVCEGLYVIHGPSVQQMFLNTMRQLYIDQ
jgi:hypothetical protein